MITLWTYIFSILIALVLGVLIGYLICGILMADMGSDLTEDNNVIIQELQSKIKILKEENERRNN